MHVHFQRITIEHIRNDEWFQRSYVPVSLLEYEDVNLDDVNAAFDDAEVCCARNLFYFIYLFFHLS